MSSLPIIFMRSPAMCRDEPMEPSAMVYLPGLLRTRSRNCSMVSAGKSLRTTSTLGTLASMLTGVKSVLGSNGSVLYRLALIEKLLKLTNSVLPSLGLLATWLAAILPPAPGLFSTSTVRPIVLLSCWAMLRATVSVVPPGGAPTTRRMGALSWAAATGAWIKATPPITPQKANLIREKAMGSLRRVFEYAWS
ncbi:hypothetical protein D3C72_1585760 [compost metagenome]